MKLQSTEISVVVLKLKQRQREIPFERIIPNGISRWNFIPEKFPGLSRKLSKMGISLVGSYFEAVHWVSMGCFSIACSRLAFFPIITFWWRANLLLWDYNLWKFNTENQRFNLSTEGNGSLKVYQPMKLYQLMLLFSIIHFISSTLLPEQTFLFFYLMPL